MELTITIKGLDEALKALAIPEERITSVAAKAAALATIAEAKPYPGASGKKQPFTSAKQRRYFFAALRKGQISVPYRRTFGLQDAWDYELTPTGATVTNPSPHADYTIVKGRQAKYHKGTWKDEEAIAKAAEPKARDAAEQAIVTEITGVI